uniref:phosphotransferase enzyme family protein n=1 Tax=Paractinoplanes polyasparticus TaxID=2856853 RepID=UPI001C84BA0B|nr:phosphotransferase [Actinoplanes polyasparticus]
MFVETRTRPVLAEVCELLGRSPDEATLIRHHTNAVYSLDDLVIKIAPPTISIDRLRKTVTLVQWLTSTRFPTVRLAGGIQQPMKVAGHGVTVWERLDATPITTGELGQLLRRLHDIRDAPPLELPRLDPIGSIRRSIEQSVILNHQESQLLKDRLADLTASWHEIDASLGYGLIQSDPQIRNALRQPDGSPVLADWDAACIGPRAWDVATVSVHCHRFGTDAHLTDFIHAYGFDPRGSESFKNLCRLRELQMIATNARKSQADSPAAREVQRRIEGLQRGSEQVMSWNIL